MIAIVALGVAVVLEGVAVIALLRAVFNHTKAIAALSEAQGATTGSLTNLTTGLGYFTEFMEQQNAERRSSYESTTARQALEQHS